ncbi:hypothetical protein Tco_1402986 [Tanacetum coccineum]
MIRSSNEANTSHAVAASLSKLELKKILIDKMEANKSVDMTDIQKNLYKALVDAYEADKDILDAYGDTRRRAGKEPNPSVHQDKRLPRQLASPDLRGRNCITVSGEVLLHKGVTSATVDDFEDPTHQEFDTGLNDDQPEEEAHPYPDWFQQPLRLPSLDRDWNKTVPADHASVQPWLSNLARQEDPRESFDELMDTPLDFSAFMINWLKVDTLTLKLLWVSKYYQDAHERHMQESSRVGIFL